MDNEITRDLLKGMHFWRRGCAEATISLYDETSLSMPAFVEVWTENGKPGPSSAVTSPLTGPAELGAVTIQVLQEYLTVGEDEAREHNKYDIVLGEGAMIKLGVWVDETGRLFKKKRHFRV